MRTVEERAQDFVSNGEYSPSLKECYIAGAAEEHLLLTHWNNIEEDKHGFTTSPKPIQMEKNTRITMKQYLSPDQTAKLIELGFEKPKGWYTDGVTNHIKLYVNIDKNPMMFNYSIGELIEMLPEVVCRSNNDDIHYYLTIYNDAMDWNIAYRDGDDELCYIFADELIDALYAMILKLKQEGVI